MNSFVQRRAGPRSAALKAVYRPAACQQRHALTCVSNHIVENNQPLKLRLQLLPGVLRQGLGLEAPQPVVGLVVALHEQLEGAQLETVAAEIR